MFGHRLFGAAMIASMVCSVPVAGAERPVDARDETGERRIALVIGNAAYPTARLANPIHDAIDVARTLGELGFEVSRLLDADQRQMESAIREFGQRLASDDRSVGLFYFAGHGIEVQRQNYLLPVDADVRSETDVKYDAVNAGRVLDEMLRAGNGLNLVILDACRNNPFARGFRGVDQGLTDMNPASGTLVLYAAEPGHQSADGAGRNGVFTEHLLQALGEPGLSVEQVFKRTALAVNEATSGAQTPWQEGVILGNFLFAPEAAPVPAAPAPTIVDRGYLQVSANVPKAEVSVGGESVGMLLPGQPLTLADGLPAGEVLVRVDAKGFESDTRRLTIRPREWTRAKFVLIPEPAGDYARGPRPRSDGPLEHLLAACRSHVDANRLTIGQSGNALDCYNAVLQRDPGNAEAQQGLSTIGRRYHAGAKTALRGGQLRRAQRYVSRLRALDVETPDLQALEREIRGARAARRAAHMARGEKILAQDTAAGDQ